MWSRIEGVAGKVRTNVSQLAKDVLEGGEDDSPQQVCNLHDHLPVELLICCSK